VSVKAEGRHRARRGEGERLRGEILEVAGQLLIETADESAVSIRAIADRVGVTPPSIYRHFADKEQLMFAVCESVFNRLDDALEKAASEATDPLDELVRKGRAYVSFGLANSESYRILFMIKRIEKVVPEGIDETNLPGSRAFLHLQDTVHRALELGAPGVTRPDDYALTCSVWTAIHGITSLRIAMPNFPWPSIDEQIELVVEPWYQALCPELARPANTGARKAAKKKRT
jgi:AcrR family transcriptional regulator